MTRTTHLIILTLTIFASRALTSIDFAPVTTNCSPQFQSLGTAEFCCDGKCIDGTLLNHPGFCQNWTSPCIEIDPTPSCANTQVMQGPSFDAAGVPVGGYCYNDLCVWRKYNWTWSCCDCPVGYVGTGRGVCGVAAYGYCARCTDPKEVLVGEGMSAMSCVIPVSSSTSRSSTGTSSIVSRISTSKISTPTFVSTSNRKSTSTSSSKTSSKSLPTSKSTSTSTSKTSSKSVSTARSPSSTFTSSSKSSKASTTSSTKTKKVKPTSSSKKSSSLTTKTTSG